MNRNPFFDSLEECPNCAPMWDRSGMINVECPIHGSEGRAKDHADDLERTDEQAAY